MTNKKIQGKLAEESSSSTEVTLSSYGNLGCNSASVSPTHFSVHGRCQKGEGGVGEKHNNPLPLCLHASQSLPFSTTATQATTHQTCSLTFYILTGYFNFVCISMEDSDSGGLISTEDDPSEESSGSTGHAHMEKKISKLKLKLRGFQNVSKNLSHYSPILSWKDSYLPLLLVIRYVLAGETSAPQ